MVRRLAFAAASLAWRVGGRVVHQLFDHPFAIDQADASADTLWPRNPEESAPPRWRFEALGESVRPSVSDGPCACPAPISRLVTEGR